MGETTDFTSQMTRSPLVSRDSVRDSERINTPNRTSDYYESPNRVQKSFKMTTKKTNFAPLHSGKQLKYGLFEHKIIDDVNNTQDWRVLLFLLDLIVNIIVDKTCSNR